MGLRCRLGGPRARGLEGRVINGRLVVFGMGEECARAICGAEREPPDDRERAWPLVKGDRVRGRRGKVDIEGLEKTG